MDCKASLLVLVLSTFLGSVGLAAQPKQLALGEPSVFSVTSVSKKSDFFLTMPCFNTEQGLALSSISCCVKDNKGILWFGTGGGGCSRYDGKKFQTLNTTNGLINNILYCIFQD